MKPASRWSRVAADNRSVTEEDMGYHVQLDFDTELFGLPFRGDVGVRYVETDLTSTGLQRSTARTSP